MLLIRLGLWLCPSSFRREYGAAIIDDVSTRRIGILQAFGDLIFQAVAIRCESLFFNFRVALRSLKNAPTFASVAILAIGVAIGTNTSVAALVQSVILRPLPFPEPQRMAFIFSIARGIPQPELSYLDVNAIRSRTVTLSSIAASRDIQGTLLERDASRILNGREVDDRYFNVLGAQPELGRFFRPQDLGSRNIVISDALWRDEFKADEGTIGTQLLIDGNGYTVVGVAPRHFLEPAPDWLETNAFWIPVEPRIYTEPRQANRTLFNVVTRLSSGTTFAAAQSDLTRIANLSRNLEPTSHAFRIVPLGDSIIGSSRSILWVIYAGVVIVFLLAASNVASLFVARAARKENELAVRAAIGASRLQITSQLVAEAGLVSLLGSLVGVLAAFIALRWLHDAVNSLLSPFYTRSIPGWDHLSINFGIMLYIALLAAAFTAFVSLLPPLTVSNTLSQSLTTGGKYGVSRSAALRKGLVIVQLVLACVLLTTAGVLARSMFVVDHIYPGFREANMYTLTVAPTGYRYQTVEGRRRLATEIKRLIEGAPGVIAIAEAAYAGLGNFYGTEYTTEGHLKTNEAPYVQYNAVSPEYFSAMNIPLLLGRVFDQHDIAGSPAVAVVSKTFAFREFRSLSALDKRVSLDFDGAVQNRRIVGVVADTRHILSSPPDPEVYVPVKQLNIRTSFIVDYSGDVSTLTSGIYPALQRFDPTLAPPVIRSFSEMRSYTNAQEQMSTLIMSVLAFSALVLSLTGIYGVVAYSVERRAREFGIRMAIGATRNQILRLILKEALQTTSVALILGLVISIPIMNSLSSILYTVSGFDVRVFFFVILLLSASTVLAAMVPALRAILANPATSLRYQ